MIRVKKRNGNLVAFDRAKIIKAIYKAFEGCRLSVDDFVVSKIAKDINIYDGISVESIQDQVENSLINFGFKDVAKAYIKYRYDHEKSRYILSRIDYMDKYAKSKENASTSSETDANANVSRKNVANLEGEVYKVTNRLIQRQRMKDMLNKLYPNSGLAKQYIEDLEHHIIYTHDEASSPVSKYYCQAVSLYPLLTDGVGHVDGVTPSAPNDIQSFSGQITNLTFLLSSQAKGATAYAGYFVALNYYVVAEFGKEWYNKLDVVFTNEHKLEKYTIRHAILKGMKQFIWGINQPAGNRSYNSPFTNISWFDKYYFDAMYGEFFYPDGTKPEWKAIDVLQRMFMKLMRDIRLVTPVTFPVTTMSLLYDEQTKEFKDKEYEKLTAEEYAKGGSFFTYMNSNPASLASCCFSKDTKFLWKSSTHGVGLTTFEEFISLPYTNTKENFEVFHNGSWVSGKVITLPNRKMYKITTYNNKEFIMSDNHINVTDDGEKQTSNLTTEDYLMFNTATLNPIPELDEHLTYAQGLLIGMFLDDGSYGDYKCKEDGLVHDFILSLNEDKIKKSSKYLNSLGTFNYGEPKNNVYHVRCSSKELVQFITKWTNCKPLETTAVNKSLNLDCLLQSVEFRQGILDGWCLTDGGNSNRCYSVSKQLIDDMEVLCTSLGLQTIVNVSDRTDEKVIIRGEEFSKNYPLYCLRWYTNANHRCNKTKIKEWKKKNNSIYWKIKSIEPVDYSDNIYCIECNNQDEPYFTLPSGLITHNCRVLNEMDENTFSSTTGMNGEMTGSCNVITLNLNRITQDWFRTLPNYQDYLVDGKVSWSPIYLEEAKPYLQKYIQDILDRVYKYHIAYKTILYNMEDAGMFESCNGNYIYMKKLYSTIGVLGYMEAAEFMGIPISNNTNYKKFLALIFNTLKDLNKLHSIKDKDRPYKFNCEAVPGENLGVKLYNWDKHDGYYVTPGRERYSCYFFNPWDKNISVLDKLVLHGGEVAKAIDGGQASHINLDSHLSTKQYDEILHFAAKEGCNYFTFNIPMSECKNCHHIVNAPIHKCPKCGSTNIRYYSRIIGYLRPVDAWSAPMQKEFTQRIFTDKTIDEINDTDPA